MSTKSVAEKMLVKPETTVWTSDPARREIIEPLPDRSDYVSTMSEAVTAIIFADDAASLRSVLNSHRESLALPANLWIAYPKANRTDINRDTLWRILAEYGLRPITQVSLGDVWSGLRFRQLRDGEAPVTGKG